MSGDDPWGDPAAPGRPPPAQPPRPGPPEAVPALRRTVDGRMLFGVAGGLGRYLGVDPSLVRIGFVLLALFGGSGVVLYLVGLVVIPEERSGEPVHAASTLRLPGNAVALAGAALVVVGGWALLRQLAPGVGAIAGPLVVLAAGVLLILAGRR